MNGINHKYMANTNWKVEIQKKKSKATNTNTLENQTNPFYPYRIYIQSTWNINQNQLSINPDAYFINVIKACSLIAMNLLVRLTECLNRPQSTANFFFHFHNWFCVKCENKFETSIQFFLSFHRLRS